MQEPLDTHVTNPANGDWFCDFCHLKNANEMWFYPHAEFIVRIPVPRTPPVLVPASSMAACYACHQIIERDNVQELVDRAMRIKIEKGHEPELNLEILEALYSGMFNGFRSRRAGVGVPKARYV